MTISNFFPDAKLEPPRTLKQAKEMAAVAARDSAAIVRRLEALGDVTLDSSDEDIQLRHELVTSLRQTNLRYNQCLQWQGELGAQRTEQFEFERAQEERLFWIRRFHTSLAIGHGAAFAAIAGHLLANERADASSYAQAFWPLAVFGTGLLVAGAIPVALSFGHDVRVSRAMPLALASATIFGVGVLLSVVQVGLAAGLILPWEMLG